MSLSLAENESLRHETAGFKVKEYTARLQSFISFIFTVDLELIMLTDTNIALLMETATSLIYDILEILHRFLFNMFVTTENPTNFLFRDLETLSLSLEGLSIDKFSGSIKDLTLNQKQKTNLSQLYSHVFNSMDYLFDYLFKMNNSQTAFKPSILKTTPQIIRLEGGKAIINATDDSLLPRPQMTFFDAPIDNSKFATFSLREEAILLGAPFTSQIQSVLESGEPRSNLVQLAQNFANSTSPSLLSPGYIWINPTNPTSRPLQIIESLVQLNELITILNKVSLFAVDVEYHSLRSYRGFSCLIQISTEYEDFIIDAISLRQHLYLLNIPFGDHTKLKIFHGCNNDLFWLQKDFSLFVVGIFDTFICASVVLSLPLPSYSLSSLVSYYLRDSSVVMDKELQLADWRIRPLSIEMIQYARADTYFLLALFRQIICKASSATPGWVAWCIRESSILALSRVSYDNDDSAEKEDALKKAQKTLNLQLSSPSIRAFNALWAWRDALAREEDESIQFILPTFMLIKIAQRLAFDPPSVLSCCTPVPPWVRTHSADIAFLVWKAAIDAEPTHDILSKDTQKACSETLIEEVQIPSTSVLEDPASSHSSIMAEILLQSTDRKSAQDKVNQISNSFFLSPWELAPEASIEETPSQGKQVLTEVVKTKELEDLTVKSKKKRGKTSQYKDPEDFIGGTDYSNKRMELEKILVDSNELNELIKQTPFAPKQPQGPLLKKGKRSLSSTVTIESPAGHKSHGKKIKNRTDPNMSRTFLA